MRLPIIPVLILMLLNMGIDWFIYRAFRQGKHPLLARIHAAFSVLLQLALVVAVCLPRRSGSDTVLLTVMWMLYGYFSVYIPKIIAALFLLLGRIPRLWHGRDWRVVPVIGWIVAFAMFVVMWWGALVNRLDWQVVEEELWFDNLPAEFDGYRIVQLSDLHVGTYGCDTTYLSKVVDEVNGLHPDVIYFTGDIVNRRSGELVPMTGTLSRLKAPGGVYAILGNHDYGDYSEWESREAKQDNMRLMFDLQDSMGWRLLLNESEIVKRGNDSIALIGVENVGDPPFTVYGDLNKAYPTVGDNLFKILLTHNPAHWVEDIADNDSVNVDLALSGHTHAMQMEVDMFGRRFSPSAWRYPTWGGLYNDKSGRHKLYVNIGMGTVAIPARIGAKPEITVLTLRKRTDNGK